MFLDLYQCILYNPDILIEERFMTYQIKCDELKRMVENGGLLIDVRSNFEFSQGSLKHAVNVPVESIPYHAEQLDRKHPVMLYCLSGARADMVKRFLESIGFENVHNLGGIGQLAHC
jgi:phage shock protein E